VQVEIAYEKDVDLVDLVPHNTMLIGPDGDHPRVVFIDLPTHIFDATDITGMEIYI
jgi:hypothetical protein